MFWGDRGVERSRPASESARELDWEVVERILREHGDAQPSFILSGGEPLLYSHFAVLADQLKRYRCFAYVCTNGVFIERHLSSIRDNPYLIFYVSIDGPREVNDRLRGEGTFERAVAGIRALKGLKPNPYVGVQITLQSGNVGHLHRTCREMVALGVDWILINLQWFVTPEQASQYEAVLAREYGVRPTSHLGFLAPYRLDRDEFVRQCHQICAERWPIQISSYLRKPEDIHVYLDHPEANPYNDFCFKEWIRMDILPDAKVTPCIQYPDLTFGSLKEGSVMDTWNGAAFARFRTRIRRQPLPVCSRCYCLYLYDAQRHVL
jgi:MoaA/NifB/PqqE/SkfB family radical SAM enzyme